jgi:4-amino-4-deoxy-L-arabinose transferase-like glycosyltransferase
MLLLYVALGALVFTWARRLYGPAGAVLATFVFALTPNTLAYTWFVNMDFGLGLAFAAAIFALWRFLEKPTRGTLLLCGAALGAALGTHFASTTLLVIFPCLLVAGAIHWSSFRKGAPRPGSPRVRAAYAGLSTRTALFLAGCFAAMCAVALFCVWAIYAFETQPLLAHAPKLEEKHEWIAANVPGPPAFRARVAQAAVEVPVPGATFARGILNIVHRTREAGTQGYWWFYLADLGMKTPLPVMILLGWAFLRRPRRPSYHEWFLLLPAGVFLLFSSRSVYQSGLRNIYPLIPLLSIYTGRILCERFTHVEETVSPGPRAKLLAAALCGWLALITVRTQPHHISYFNAFVGGSDHGFRYAVGSVDVDWGQGLVGVAKELAARKIDRVTLAASSTTDPAIYGIRARRLRFDDIRDPRDLSPGVYVISTTYVAKLDWLARREPFAKVGNVMWLYRID